MKSKLKVRKSRIHGKGLFAKKAISTDSLLGFCKTKRVRKEGPYVLTLGSGKQVRVTCKFRYINHSKNPNVAYYDDLSVVTLRDIRKGEELTHDYGEEWQD